MNTTPAVIVPEFDPTQAKALAFSHAIAPGRSSRYETVNSGMVQECFASHNLTLRSVTAKKLNQKSLAKGAMNGLQKHIFRFDTGIALPDNSKLEVLLRNSYDGSTAFGLSLGVFRLVCSNGLIVGTSFINVSIPHVGQGIWDRVSQGISRVLTEGPRLADTIERWRSVELNQDRMLAFAQRAAAKLLPENSTVLNPESLIRIRRTGDQTADLWTVFNRIQENVTNGGLHYRTEGDALDKVRHTRRIRGADKLFKSNVALWDLASETEAEVVA